MEQQVTPSQLRANIYKLVDAVLETGIPLQINRHGRKLLLVAAEPVPDRLAAISAVPGAIVGDPEGLVHIDWSSEWDPDRALEP